MQEENINDTVLPEEGDNTSVSNEGFLKLLEKETGKVFKDEATAIKAIKDTFSYVGKGKQKENELEERLKAIEAKANIAETLEEDMFYTKNAEYAPYKDLIKTLGAKPSEVIAKPEFQAVYEKLKSFDEKQSKKSVIMGNNRIASETNTMQEANKLMREGKFEDAGSKAVQAVLDAFSE